MLAGVPKAYVAFALGIKLDCTKLETERLFNVADESMVKVLALTLSDLTS